MLRPNTKIVITQIPNDAYPKRNGSFILDFVNYVEINSSWQNLTDTAKLKIPRDVYVEDDLGTIINWADNAIYGTEGDQVPLFMRGDRITISLGYFSDFDLSTGAYVDAEKLYMPDEPQFSGYITKIKNRIPIEIECEDEMWKLKQFPAPNKLFKGSQYNLKDIVAECLKGSEYTVTDGGFQVNIGDFRVQNETVAQVLERIRRDGAIYCSFRGKELRCSGVVYDPKIMDVQEVFEFQENIINDSLEYNRKEDLNIAVKAYSQNIVDATGNNNDGTQKKGHKRIEVLVGKVFDQSGHSSFGEIKDPKSYHGDLVTFPVIGATTKAQLIDRAKKYLPKFYYTGFRGSFLTYGYPFVEYGNAAIIRDNKIPERSGTYLIKQVVITSGMQGFHQKINLHLRIDQGFTQQDLNAGVCG